MLGFIKKFFTKKSLAPLEAIVLRINEKEKEIAALSNEQILAASLALKEALRGKEQDDEDDIVAAFALAREAAKRTLGQRPYDVQLLGGLVLARGGVSEMSTGEGKTLAAVAPAYYMALKGRGMHVVTVNEYLARRDAVWMGQIYKALGLSVSCLVPNGAFSYDPDFHIPEEAPAMIDAERDTTGSYLVQQEYLRPVSRRAAYAADITYGTNHEFGFDYLRDNLAYGFDQQVQRGHQYAIIDEVDSILIDEARTPLIVSAPDAQSSESYKAFARIVAHLQEEEDYTVDEKLKNVSITESGIAKAEKASGVANLYATENLRLVHYLEESLKAKALFKRDRDYVVKEGEIVIVDEFTGRMLHGRRYNGGLHQAIEAKEGVAVKEESKTYAKISIQNYFRMYSRISGMTGTAQTSAEEFFKTYNLEVYSIPTHRPKVRKDVADLIYKDSDAKTDAIIKEVGKRIKAGQPVLIGTTSIAKNELISDKLKRAGIAHEVLNAKNNEREGAIIAQAGRPGAVTVATNMAGRGVDIILGGNPPKKEEAARVREAGGLCVIGTERHEARRIDNQLRGRAGRQGDPGESMFFMSLEDDLLRIFGGERIKTLMERFNMPPDEPIQVGFVAKAVEEAQAKVEGAAFDMRKHLLEYDDVLNKQRSAVYTKRQKILTCMTPSDVAALVEEAAYGALERNWREKEKISGEGPTDEMIKELLLGAAVLLPEEEMPQDVRDPEDLRKVIVGASSRASADPQTLFRMLSVLDMLWMNHLDDLEALSESVNLRAYGQRDPLVEYKREANMLYKNFWANFNEWVFVNIFKMAAISGGADIAVSAPAITVPAQSAPQGEYGGTGRNDPCPCGSGKKYKKCHGK